MRKVEWLEELEKVDPRVKEEADRDPIEDEWDGQDREYWNEYQEEVAPKVEVDQFGVSVIGEAMVDKLMAKHHGSQPQAKRVLPRR